MFLLVSYLAIARPDIQPEVGVASESRQPLGVAPGYVTVQAEIDPRRVHGRVTTDRENTARSGGGRQPSHGEQVVRSFADSPSCTPTLVPAEHG